MHLPVRRIRADGGESENLILYAPFASFWPARNASRLTVRDVLAYE